jgi:hypothetical protein
MAGVEAASRADIFVFLDGDGSDYPHEMLALLQPILSGEASLVIGSRARGESQAGSMTLPQRFGNKLACTLMRWFWKSEFTDLGPFRAIDRAAYERLNMSAPTFGWTVQMQVRALKYDVKSTEIPVSYRQRLGVSKISGTVKGVILAGFYILGTIFWEKIFHKVARANTAPK